MVERKGATWMRGFVQSIFIICYAAFMLASIHHLAYFFSSFEPGGGVGLLSYLLAGAFDVTALVTTIAVMFFRKSMPLWVFFIVWGFILLIAGFSYFVNWEYESHFQSTALTLQPTGETTPVFDQQGNLHYVPVMHENTGLLVFNPLLGAGFVVFSLIYSIIAEFFGAKPPSLAELEAKAADLEKRKPLMDKINSLEGTQSGPSFIERAKQAAIEAKDAYAEVTKKDEAEQEGVKKEQRGLFAGHRRNKVILEQMRALAVEFGWRTIDEAGKMKPEVLRLFLVPLGLWDASANEPTEATREWRNLRAEALARGWLSQEEVAQERSLPPSEIQARYEQFKNRLQQVKQREMQREQQRLKEEQEREQQLLETARQVAQGREALPTSQPSSSLPPQAAMERTAPVGAQPTQNDAFQDWWLLDEVASAFEKTPEAIKNWFKEDAKPPRRFEPDEVYRYIENGKVIIKFKPEAVARIQKELLKKPKNEGASNGSRGKRGESNPRLPTVAVSTNSQPNGDVAPEQIAVGAEANLV